jgi:hypothetical protein
MCTHAASRTCGSARWLFAAAARPGQPARCALSDQRRRRPGGRMLTDICRQAARAEPCRAWLHPWCAAWQAGSGCDRVRRGGRRAAGGCTHSALSCANAAAVCGYLRQGKFKAEQTPSAQNSFDRRWMLPAGRVPACVTALCAPRGSVAARAARLQHAACASLLACAA